MLSETRACCRTQTTPLSCPNSHLTARFPPSPPFRSPPTTQPAAAPRALPQQQQHQQRPARAARAAASSAPRAVGAAAVEVQEPGTVLMSAVEMWNGDKRLQTQVFQLAQDTVCIRSLDYDRDRFDIEFG